MGGGGEQKTEKSILNKVKDVRRVEDNRIETQSAKVELLWVNLYSVIKFSIPENEMKMPL